MSNVTRWDLAKDIVTRKDANGKKWGRGGTSVRYTGKGSSGEVYRTYMEFTRDWSDMTGGTITSAVLALHTHEGSDFELNSGATILLYALSEDFSNDNNDAWTPSAWDEPKYGSTQVGAKRSGIPVTDDQPFTIDVINYLQRIAPNEIKVQIGTSIKPGTGDKHPDHGLLLRSADDGRTAESAAFYSGDGAAAPHSRPYINITWEPANTPPTATWGGPLGGSSSDEDYVGTYFDPDGDRASYAQVQVWRDTDDYPANPNDPSFSTPRYDSGRIAWQPGWPDDQYIVPPPQRLNPAKSVLSRKDGNGNLIHYRGRVKVWDTRDTDKDKGGPWSPLGSGLFTVATSDPVVTPEPVDAQDTLSITVFHAGWSFDPAAGSVVSYRVQLTTASDSGAWAQPIWEHTFAPTQAEQNDKRTTAPTRNGRASFVYLGPSLPEGDYSWRIMVVDSLGSDSAWAQDDSLYVTNGTTTAPDPPDNSTVYGRFAITTRLVMRRTDGAKRGPGTVVAIIENPYNLGVTGNATTAGQLYFSLPNKHPQIAAMEPMRTHWSLQQYRGSEWKELTAGLLTDFDATENDTVFQGLDYLGVLGLSIEGRGQPEDHAEASWDANGAKYVNHSISYIISDQLKRAIASSNAPLGFFQPTPSVDSMLEKVTIHSAYAQRLDFIRGLMESHRGGASGRRSRITAAKNPVSGLYEFTVRSTAGKDRPNLRFSYGGLVQAYRVMALGDWADKVYGVGRLRNQLKPHYLSMEAPGVDLGSWGEIAKANVWQDISDTLDLTRRARQMATEVSRAGKRIALGLRAHGLALLDGWSICDNIVLDIEDGSVSTSHYGTSGWWTIWGWEWRLYPDGHDELTLVIKPTEGIGAPVDDLIPSHPIHVQPEWSVGHGLPLDTDWLQLDAGYFLDAGLRLDSRR